MIRRRYVLAGALAMPSIARAQTRPRVVVVGGGFGGLTAARFVRIYDPSVDVLLIEPSDRYIACPFSNLVIAKEREWGLQTFDYPADITRVKARAVSIDPAARNVAASDSQTYPYDRLILSPGIDINWQSLPGYNEAAANILPHAWKAGEQTLLLRRQLEEMPDGGVVVMSVPPNPFRCPPGPYERASLIAWYLKKAKPKSKILVLDAKDVFSKQKLFQNAWKQLYPGLLEWVSLSDGGKVVRIDPATKTFETEFGSHKADVGVVVPPQVAGNIAKVAADRSGWCPIDPVTFESKLAPGIHVALSHGEQPAEPRLINTCYSVAAPDYGFSVAGVYKPVNGVLTDIEGAGGISPLDAPEAQRIAEARYGDRWFQTITSEVFG